MLIAIFLLTASSVPASEADVLAQLRSGKMLCSNPDSTTKTCSTIDTFTSVADGAFVDTGELLLSPDKPVTLEVSSIVRIENGAICGSMELPDLQRGRVRFNGSLVPPDRNALLLDRIVEALKPLAGRKVCEALRTEAGQLVKYGQVERVDLNLTGKPVKWITSDEGYKVAPR